MKRKIMLSTLTLNEMGIFKARARLRLLDDAGIVKSDLHLEADISDELHERIRFEVEKAIAAAVGEDVGTFSDGTRPEFAEAD